ncbi:MAG TPA: DUF3617 family protein [Sphingobium sp.]
MRGTTISLLMTATFLAACSAEAPPEATEEAPVALKAGQWMLTRTYTAYKSAATATPEDAKKIGTKSETSICLPVAADGKADPSALAGDDGTDCKYKETYMNGGRFVGSMACKAGAGTSELQIEGSYKADSMDFTANMAKTVGGNTALSTSYTLEGKRTGECAKS